jgi:hypothetical protein
MACTATRSASLRRAFGGRRPISRDDLCLLPVAHVLGGQAGGRERLDRGSIGLACGHCSTPD